MRPWFEEHPQRLEYELEALRGSGFAFSFDEHEKAKGQIVLYVTYQIGEETHALTVKFPDLYPYFPFDIFAPTFPPGKHIHPYSGLLCTLQSPHQKWQTRDTLANFLATQVSDIVAAHLIPDAAENLEAHEGTQVSGFFAYKAGATVYTGEWSIPAEHTYGKLLLGLESGSDPNKTLRGIVIEVQDELGNSLAKLDEAIARRYPKRLSARWVRVSPPLPDIEGGLLDKAAAAWPALKEVRFKGGPDIVGLLFPEEAGYQEPVENWAFVVRVKKSDRSGKVLAYLARADRLSRANMQARVPRLSPLADKKVLIVGLGAIGATCAWQIARAGIGTLRLMDFDHVQVGNLPRWVFGFHAVGWPKAMVVADHIVRDYPFVLAKPYIHRLGGSLDREGLADALEGVDLILDATAEWCVNHYLSDLAKRRGIPYVWATGTPGSYGGIVGRITPNRTKGCWKCFQRHLTAGTIATPTQEDVPDVQPVGCFQPTFTGSGFDMDHVALAAVRLAVATLCAGKEDAYPDFDWDVGVLDLWKESGYPIAPQWSTHQLCQHADCQEHG